MKKICHVTIQQTVAFSHVTHVARGTSSRMHRAQLGIRINVCFHAKEHLFTRLAPMLIEIALVVFELGR